MRGPPRAAIAAGFLLGVGLAGLLDGIVFHQLLEWHHFVSARTGDARTNVLADGAFHLGAWIATFLGVALAWRHRTVLPGRSLVAAAVAGAAAFNLLDVVVNHFLLRVHTLHPSGSLVYEGAFVLLNVAVGAYAWHRLEGGYGSAMKRTKSSTLRGRKV